jgi:hypothetical protein
MPQIRIAALIRINDFVGGDAPLFHRRVFAAGGNDFANSWLAPHQQPNI